MRLFILLLGIVALVSADLCEWTGGSQGSWGQYSWSCGHMPTAEDSVMIKNAKVTIDNVMARAQTLSLLKDSQLILGGTNSDWYNNYIGLTLAPGGSSSVMDGSEIYLYEEGCFLNLGTGKITFMEGTKLTFRAGILTNGTVVQKGETLITAAKPNYHLYKFVRDDVNIDNYGTLTIDKTENYFQFDGNMTIYETGKMIVRSSGMWCLDSRSGTSVITNYGVIENHTGCWFTPSLVNKKVGTVKCTTTCPFYGNTTIDGNWELTTNVSIIQTTMNSYSARPTPYHMLFPSANFYGAGIGTGAGINAYGGYFAIMDDYTVPTELGFALNQGLMMPNPNIQRDQITLKFEKRAHLNAHIAGNLSVIPLQGYDSYFTGLSNNATLTCISGTTCGWGLSNGGALNGNSRMVVEKGATLVLGGFYSDELWANYGDENDTGILINHGKVMIDLGYYLKFAARFYNMPDGELHVANPGYLRFNGGSFISGLVNMTNGGAIDFAVGMCDKPSYTGQEPCPIYTKYKHRIDSKIRVVTDGSLNDPFHMKHERFNFNLGRDALKLEFVSDDAKNAPVINGSFLFLNDFDIATRLGVKVIQPVWFKTGVYRCTGDCLAGAEESGLYITKYSWIGPDYDIQKCDDFVTISENSHLHLFHTTDLMDSMILNGNIYINGDRTRAALNHMAWCSLKKPEGLKGSIYIQQEASVKTNSLTGTWQYKVVIRDGGKVKIGGDNGFNNTVDILDGGLVQVGHDYEFGSFSCHMRNKVRVVGSGIFYLATSSASIDGCDVSLSDGGRFWPYPSSRGSWPSIKSTNIDVLKGGMLVTWNSLVQLDARSSLTFREGGIFFINITRNGPQARLNYTLYEGPPVHGVSIRDAIVLSDKYALLLYKVYTEPKQREPGLLETAIEYTGIPAPSTPQNLHQTGSSGGSYDDITMAWDFGPVACTPPSLRDRTTIWHADDPRKPWKVYKDDTVYTTNDRWWNGTVVPVKIQSSCWLPGVGEVQFYGFSQFSAVVNMTAGWNPPKRLRK